MYDLPRIRIELDGMKYQIIHAFQSHNQEIEDAVERNLQSAIDNFPFEGTIQELSREIIAGAIKEALECYFKYGEGREVIKKAVVERLDHLYD